MKKKKIIIISSIILFLLLLIPLPFHIKDGGSVQYAAILYSVTDVHALAEEDGVFGHNDGIRVKILGIEIYEKTEFVPDKNQN